MNVRSKRCLKKTAHSLDPGHPSLSGPLSYKQNKCQGFNFYIKVICLGHETVSEECCGKIPKKERRAAATIAACPARS